MTQPSGDPNPVPSAPPIIPYATPVGPLPGMPVGMQYDLVPWYRKSGFVSSLVVIGVILGLPLLAACILVVTGPVYFPRLGRDGRLKTWGPANKVVAAVLLAAWLATFAIRMLR